MSETIIRAALSHPYARTLGFVLDIEDGVLTGRLPFTENLIGNPLVPALHGGILAALLQLTATGQLMLKTGSPALPRLFTATQEFLANPALKTTYAAASLVTRTRRFANLRAIAWQGDRAAPVAAATLQFLLG